MKSKNMKLGMFLVGCSVIFVSIMALLFLWTTLLFIWIYYINYYFWYRYNLAVSLFQVIVIHSLVCQLCKVFKRRRKKNDESMVILEMMRTPRKTTNRQRNSNFNENTYYMHMSKVLFIASWNFSTWNSTGIELHIAWQMWSE